MARIAALILAALILLACTAPPPRASLSAAPGSKPVSFAMLEVYDKGDDLAAIARDFALLPELEMDTLRCSFGWDDYEPAPGVYDFAWLKQFVALADECGIQLRPYIGYTPEWAGDEGATMALLGKSTMKKIHLSGGTAAKKRERRSPPAPQATCIDISSCGPTASRCCLSTTSAQRQLSPSPCSAPAATPSPTPLMAQRPPIPPSTGPRSPIFRSPRVKSPSSPSNPEAGGCVILSEPLFTQSLRFSCCGCRGDIMLILSSSKSRFSLALIAVLLAAVGSDGLRHCCRSGPFAPPWTVSLQVAALSLLVLRDRLVCFARRGRSGQGRPGGSAVGRLHA